MVATRFPDSGLTSEYGDIVISSVTAKVTVLISYADTAVTILTEDYYPDATGKIIIPNIGKLALMHMDPSGIVLSNETNGGTLALYIKLTELTGIATIIEKTVTFYHSDVDFSGTINTMIAYMPLSRTTRKITAPNRKEFISFYGSFSVYAYVVKRGTVGDVTVSAFLKSMADYKKMYHIDVSPSVIASAAGCAVADLVYYNIYIYNTHMIRFTMDQRNYPTTRTFVFRNSFGAVETFTCTGDTENERTWEREFGLINNNNIQTDKELKSTIKVNTGYLSQRMVPVLEDLLNSDQIYLLAGNTIHPIVITDEDFSNNSRNYEVKSFELTYRFTSNAVVSKYVPLALGDLFDATFDNTFN